METTITNGKICISNIDTTTDDDWVWSEQWGGHDQAAKVKHIILSPGAAGEWIAAREEVDGAATGAKFLPLKSSDGEPRELPVGSVMCKTCFAWADCSIGADAEIMIILG